MEEKRNPTERQQKPPTTTGGAINFDADKKRQLNALASSKNELQEEKHTEEQQPLNWLERTNGENERHRDSERGAGNACGTEKVLSAFGRKEGVVIFIQCDFPIAIAIIICGQSC